MFKNYFKTAWRNLVVSKMYSVINIAGLATGMAVVILISLWIFDEMNYNNYHNNHQQIAQVVTTLTYQDGKMETTRDMCAPIGDELRTKYGSDFKNVCMASNSQPYVIAVGNKKMLANGLCVQSSFPAMFSLKMLKGDGNQLEEPSSVLISASLEKALFGKEDGMNKLIKLENEVSYKVAGVYEDIPYSSAFYDTRLLLSWHKFIIEGWPRFEQAATNWNLAAFQAFVQVADNIDMRAETEKIKNVLIPHKVAASGLKETASLFPMDKWRLYSEFKNGRAADGRIQFVWLFSIIGFFVLLLACINFMNLFTARSAKRAKEVGIRKTVGSLRKQLIGQFLCESVLMAMVSFLCSLILVVSLLPLFNHLADKSLVLPTGYPLFWLIAIAFTVLTGLFAGSYPALYLSKFEPIKVLNGTYRAGRFARLPRKVLVVMQFTFSIALAIGTTVVFKQIQFAKNRPANYTAERLIAVTHTNPEVFPPYDALRQDLLATAAVENMATSSTPVTAVWNTETGFNWQGKDPNYIPDFGTLWVSGDFGKTIGWKIKAGRDFSRDLATDSLGIVLNEAAVRLVGLKKNIVGENVQLNGINYTVIGVIKDMIMESPYSPVRPTVFFRKIRVNEIIVSIKQGWPVKDALDKIKAVFAKYEPSALFSYTFIDENYAKKFADEQLVGKLAVFFSILSVFIACLGLFGLASFVAEQRRKEIGVRKVLGASVYDLWQMLSKEFALLVVISCAIAIPIAWFYLNEWLKQYDYRTTISIWVFVVSGFGALAIVLITVSFQSIKAALVNPVRSLRSD